MQGVGGGQPSASDMFELKWSNELATVAQRWADQCTWHHDAERVNAACMLPIARTRVIILHSHPGTQGTNEFDHVGQNMAMSKSSRAPDSSRGFVSFIQGWYDEVKDFPPGNVGGYGNTGNLGHTGHYSQVGHKAQHISGTTHSLPKTPLGCVGRDEGGGVRIYRLQELEQHSVRSAFHLQLRPRWQHAGLRGLRRRNDGQWLSWRQRGWSLHLVVPQSIFIWINDRTKGELKYACYC